MSEILADLLQAGIQAIKQGDLKAGEKSLAQVIKTGPKSEYAEMAWIWISFTFDDPEHKRACFNNALKINPDNVLAKTSLATLPDLDMESTPIYARKEGPLWMPYESERFLPRVNNTRPLQSFARK